MSFIRTVCREPDHINCIISPVLTTCVEECDSLRSFSAVEVCTLTRCLVFFGCE